MLLNMNHSRGSALMFAKARPTMLCIQLELQLLPRVRSVRGYVIASVHLSARQYWIYTILARFMPYENV